ncbi:hypothetical protein [Gabonibacter chumensis]|uniref:hypothetical protein n=1 Tax=Gabonibacter chumensis TaxID=2972474 RepID=UPI002572A9B3|nr:hypothetical protein [Gabonibacter chumensis]MCR9011132.1 hypothetical protein [Gabonibacter chumensis]
MKQDDIRAELPTSASEKILGWRYFIVVVTMIVLGSAPLLVLVYDDVALLMLFMACAILWFLVIPCIGIWIYSFVKSIMHRTKHDKILLALHIVNIIQFIIICTLNTTCSAEIMEAHYIEHKQEFQTFINNTRHRLPDSTSIDIEFNRRGEIDRLSTNTEIDQSFINELRSDLEKIGCRGFAIGTNHFVFLFRRIDLGAYYFYIYDHPLIDEEIEKFNHDPGYIVFDRQTLFYYGGGAIGTQEFLGKKVYLQKKGDTQ